MLMGTVGCGINLIVFTRKNLRKNPCSIYFIAYNVANLGFIYALLLSATMEEGYNINVSIQSLIICRLRLYTGILFDVLSPFYLILASIDRILVTSQDALVRQKSTRRLALLSVIGGTLFWTLFQSHALVLTNIIQVGPDLFVCYFQPGVYLDFFTFYAILKQFVFFLLMIICGVWSIKNIRNLQRVRIAPDLSVSRTVVENSSQATAKKDRQMILMLLIDIIISALFSFVYAIYLLYLQITQNYNKTTDRTEIEDRIGYLCLFCIGIPYCVSCYANLIVSKTFRNEVKKVFLCG
ncbi:unnamed protein product [Adineta steineri]|uniref:G-protein coupled receptors family 1 profile domain-containing protein n=2 Tax=Adineta steineri TaxID=433720 RepID=A0A815BHA4_9BILA|nr:unnamed protein product [Adineta steineri]